jgi:hypothetical protein
MLSYKNNNILTILTYRIPLQKETWKHSFCKFSPEGKWKITKWTKSALATLYFKNVGREEMEHSNIILGHKHTQGQKHPKLSAVTYT